MIIETLETTHGKVEVIEEKTGFFVRYGNHWVIPIFSTVGYPREKPSEAFPDKEEAMRVANLAVQDSEIVHEAVSGKANRTPG